MEQDSQVSFEQQLSSALEQEGILDLKWKEFNISSNKEICYINALDKEQQESNKNSSKNIENDQLIPIKIQKKELELSNKNRLDDIANDIMMRYKKYGGLEVNSKIARKTGAYNRDELTEKDINYYDQDDPFIDDSEVNQQNEQNKMALPEPRFSDFFCFNGDLKLLMQTQEYKERLQVINQITKQGGINQNNNNNNNSNCTNIKQNNEMKKQMDKSNVKNFEQKIIKQNKRKKGLPLLLQDQSMNGLDLNLSFELSNLLKHQVQVSQPLKRTQQNQSKKFKKLQKKQIKSKSINYITLNNEKDSDKIQSQPQNTLIHDINTEQNQQPISIIQFPLNNLNQNLKGFIN